MKIYRGTRGIDGLQVWVNDRPLDERRDLKELSHAGFEWTYEGAGPAQLALAILADCLEDDARALALYEAFMSRVVADLDNDWELTEEAVVEAVSRLESS